jgi:hypothetical protein
VYAVCGERRQGKARQGKKAELFFVHHDCTYHVKAKQSKANQTAQRSSHATFLPYLPLLYCTVLHCTVHRLLSPCHYLQYMLRSTLNSTYLTTVPTYLPAVQHHFIYLSFFFSLRFVSFHFYTLLSRYHFFTLLYLLFLLFICITCIFCIFIHDIRFNTFVIQSFNEFLFDHIKNCLHFLSVLSASGCCLLLCELSSIYISCAVHLSLI